VPIGQNTTLGALPIMRSGADTIPSEKFELKAANPSEADVMFLSSMPIYRAGIEPYEINPK
jgi:hypothetical protein